MKGRVAFYPSLTFGLCGVLLPVGPRHVKAQGADWQGLWGTDKNAVEIRLPLCSLPQTNRSPLHSLTEEERNNNRGMLLCVPEAGSGGIFLFDMCFFLFFCLVTF